MGFKSDIEIAQEAQMKVINEIADSIGIPDKYVENYGKYKAKIDYRYYKDELETRPDAKVILVTAINPTPAGEGKTTTVYDRSVVTIITNDIIIAVCQCRNNSGINCETS